MKAYFLGPKSENEAFVRSEIQSILDHWFSWRKSLFPEDPEAISADERLKLPYLQERERMSQALAELNDLLKDETPKFTPRYFGHMVSELSLPAIFGHFATLLHNPNNTSRESARVGTIIEREALAMLAELVGYDPARATGHFTSGGTIANFEAIWRARFRQDHWLSLALYLAETNGVYFRLFDAAHMGWASFWDLIKKYHVTETDLRAYSSVAGNPYRNAELLSQLIGQPYRGPVILVPGNKHFSWQKGTNIFGFGEEAFWSIATDEDGHLSVDDLKLQIERAEEEMRPVLMAVSVAGTTEAGEIDPVDKVAELIQELKDTRGRYIWHHVDAAYGGFMCSVLHQGGSKWFPARCEAALRGMKGANSITLDPHKLGYVPYACGAFLARNEENYAVSSFKAAYLDRPDLGQGKWSTTMEGSRSAAGAAATWLTGKSMGFTSPAFAEVISSTFEACHAFREALVERFEFVRVLEPVESNILCFSVAQTGERLSDANCITLRITELFMQSPNFAVSRTDLAMEHMGAQIHKHVTSYDGEIDTDHLVLIRCVFMNPFLASEDVRKPLLEEFLAEFTKHHANAISDLPK